MVTSFGLLDDARRQLGHALDLVGLGPVEAPFRVVAKWPGAQLRAYHPRVGAAGPVLLILPAPIKRAYIWDLLPQVSVVRHCLRRGLRVFLLEWLDPGPSEDGFGLADYADRLPLAALDVISAETGCAAALLAGHSLGGTLAAIFASLRPERVRGLVLIEAPLAFGTSEGGPLARSIAAMPHARELRALSGSPVPGSFLGFLAISALPQTFLLRRWSDLGASLADPPATAVHVRVERWTLEELAMPGALFDDVFERLYREDRFRAGTLTVSDGRLTGAARLQCPVLAVVNNSGQVVPPAAMLAALGVVPGLRLRTLYYEGGHGAALEHVAPLVAPLAHEVYWPQILDWLEQCWSES
jgi:polyhydroxyalkanoate synthase subunit PhaC